MRQAAVLYNPVSGQGARRRIARVTEVLRVLKSAGVTVEAIPTSSPGSAAAQASEAIRRGCDTIIVCGGDGTVHETIQAMVGETAALGVIPMGTANALAADLGIPRSPAKAARMLLQATPKRISVGRVEYQAMAGGEQSRYFIVAAGFGVDAHFFSELDSRLKQRFGYLAYLVEALRLWATHSFPSFIACFTEPGRETPRAEEVSQALAVRITNFGGLVNHLVPSASLASDRLQVIAFKTRSRLRYMRFMAAVWFGRHTYSDTIELVECTAVECRDLPGSTKPTLVEADGELLGSVPARIEIVPQALTVLVPTKSST